MIEPNSTPEGTHYALTVPGGFVTGGIIAFGKKVDAVNWNDSKVEPYFHTLRVVLKPPSAST
jgi:hypothetical protein